MANRFFCDWVGLLRLVAGQSRAREREILNIFTRALVTVPVLAGQLSCAAHRTAATGDAKLVKDAEHAPGVRVAGYTMNDGSYHPFNGYLVHASDSLVFVRPADSERFRAADPPQRVALMRDQIASVRLQEGISIPRSVLFGLSLVAFFALMWAIVGGPFITGING